MKNIANSGTVATSETLTVLSDKLPCSCHLSWYTVLNSEEKALADRIGSEFAIDLFDALLSGLNAEEALQLLILTKYSFDRTPLGDG